ncbi:MAG: AMP-binding protein [Rhodospirillaceae bacterium]|jgi:long-chain acyl-CoA synthetase|nr:AMP-binding protein [Rhodospirillaceae bacterium]MBT5895468.1 AMP-binding protein [Rhodospirillaceae bacterium]MBT6426896.1 AMP-binding protein [Rhodospirillaceae bacterium]MBT7761019.1 AMP-binding protein [Rhodospirillaceae bacterium]
MNQASLLHKVALSFGDRPAVTNGLDCLLDYRGLSDRAARLGGALTNRLGLNKGDRVAIMMKNAPQFFEVLYGAWHAGLAAVPINAKLHPREAAFILENSGARVCFITDDLVATIPPLSGEIADLEAVIATAGSDYDALFMEPPAAMTDCEPDDLAWLFYTSGTTGRPKGAMLTQRNLMAMVMNYYADMDTVGPEDCMIHGAPLSHGSGLFALPHVAKGANNIIPLSGGFDPEETLELLPHFPNASFFFAPTMLTRLVNLPGIGAADTSNIKTIVYGGGPMYVEDTLKALEVLGPKLVQLFGQGESPMTITGLSRAMHQDTAHPDFQKRLGSVGIARTDVDVRVVDGDDNELAMGEMGEVVCRGDVIMAGYWNNPDASRDALRGGWLHTGDVGAFDEHGFLTLMDRAKDMIISGGSNIYPREVEEVLLRHPGVNECSVVGRHHADWGEEVVAFVVNDPGQTVTTAELDDLCLEHIARFKRPKDYRFVAALPKNNYGKVLKTELRATLVAEEGA